MPLDYYGSVHDSVQTQCTMLRSADYTCTDQWSNGINGNAGAGTNGRHKAEGRLGEGE